MWSVLWSVWALSGPQSKAWPPEKLAMHLSYRSAGTDMGHPAFWMSSKVRQCWSSRDNLASVPGEETGSADLLLL